LARPYAENDLLAIIGHLCEGELAGVNRRKGTIPSHGNDAS
jgi:hypothetical protein